jgi:hypothetical protein
MVGARLTLLAPRASSAILLHATPPAQAPVARVKLTAWAAEVICTVVRFIPERLSVLIALLIVPFNPLVKLVLV